MTVNTRATMEGAELLGRMRYGVNACTPAQLEEMLNYILEHRDIFADILPRRILRAMYNNLNATI
jgi:hypothetical protein